MDTITTLPGLDAKNAETGCCPRFDPKPWDQLVFDLSGYKFVKTQTKSFFYMPLNMDKVFSAAMAAIEAAGAKDPDRYLILSKDLNSWKAEHHFLVTKPVPSLESSSPGTKFYAKVYEGPFQNTGQWIKDFLAHCSGKNLNLKAIYSFYTTCPKCAKAYGKNYVVLFGQLE